MQYIPKKLHYCWFGGGKKNKLIEKCIKSWSEFLPDFEIIEWNESNFDININPYVKQAYENKKWAFVSDYVRLFVLYKYGGVYVDTDLEITNSIDNFLCHKVFTSYENDSMIPTAIMGSCANHGWIEYLLSYYDNKYFLKNDGSEDLTTNVITITKMTKEKYNIELNNKYIKFGDDVNIYPKEFFCLKKQNHDNYSIHHFNGSWIPLEKKIELYKNSYLILNKLLIEKYSNNKESLIAYIKNNGIKNIAIYGGGTIGKLVIEILGNSNIIPNIIIDNGLKEQYYKEIQIINMEKLKSYDDVKIDLIIITPTQFYKEIYLNLQKIVDNQSQIISINEILKIDLPNYY